MINEKIGKEAILEDIRRIEKGVPIEWDRVVETEHFIDVYGWIPKARKDDFILVRFEIIENENYISFTTSSAKYSKIIAKNLECNAHNDCIKFKDYFKGV